MFIDPSDIISPETFTDYFFPSIYLWSLTAFSSLLSWQLVSSLFILLPHSLFVFPCSLSHHRKQNWKAFNSHWGSGEAVLWSKASHHYLPNDAQVEIRMYHLLHSYAYLPNALHCLGANRRAKQWRVPRERLKWRHSQTLEAQRRQVNISGLGFESPSSLMDT